MNHFDRIEQQKNRLSYLSDDSSIGLEFIKELIEAATGKPVKSIIPMQVFGDAANYVDDNRAFYAINLTLFPANYVPPATGGTVTDAGQITSGTLSDGVLSSNVVLKTDVFAPTTNVIFNGDVSFILTSPNGTKAKVSLNDDLSLQTTVV